MVHISLTTSSRLMNHLPIKFGVLSLNLSRAQRAQERSTTMKDFIYKLADYIKELELEYPIKIGIFDDSSSLVIRPLTGSETIREYMDGTVDSRLPFEISIKSKNQEEAYNVLGTVMNHVRNISDFLKYSEDDTHVLLNVVIDQIPTFQENTDSYFYYTSRLTVDLTVV